MEVAVTVDYRQLMVRQAQQIQAAAAVAVAALELLEAQAGQAS